MYNSQKSGYLPKCWNLTEAQAQYLKNEEKYSFKVNKLENSSLELQRTQCTSLNLRDHIFLSSEVMYLHL